MYRITILGDGAPIETLSANGAHDLRNVLAMVADRIRGTHGLESVVRYCGEVVAELRVDYRGAVVADVRDGNGVWVELTF
jgi:hypothetical protein